MKTINDVDLYISTKEGLKVPVNIAQIKEIRAIISELIAEYPEALVIILQNGVSRLKKRDKDGC